MDATAAAAAYPESLALDLVQAAEISTDARQTVAAMLARPEYRSPQTALMAGLAAVPEARAMLDNALQRYARPTLDSPTDVGELIIGAGAHAATYAAVRVSQGYARPLVLTSAERFGGAFAASRRATFYLNSRNRPGPIGTPGTRAALNVIPGAPMQPADIGGSEYQANDALALVIRCALALNATIRLGQATSVEPIGNTTGAIVETDQGDRITARRVIIATGLSEARTVAGMKPDGRRVYSFAQWLDRLDSERFPLRNLGRVAVIGAGDSGRVVIESLTGQGPGAGQSMAALDYVTGVQWYGAADQATTRQQWEACNRSRYKPIGRLLPDERDALDNARVTPRGRAKTIGDGYQVATVDGEPFDTIISAPGAIAADWSSTFAADVGPFRYATDDPTGNRQGQKADRADVYVVGPAASLPFSADEERAQFSRISDNRVGLFRLAPRTAALAARLDEVRP